jgi:hypothetical protein
VSLILTPRLSIDYFYNSRGEQLGSLGSIWNYHSYVYLEIMTFSLIVLTH